MLCVYDGEDQNPCDVLNPDLCQPHRHSLIDLFGNTDKSLGNLAIAIWYSELRKLRKLKCLTSFAEQLDLICRRKTCI